MSSWVNLAGMALVFFTGIFMLPGLGFVTKIVSIAHQYVIYCWTRLAQNLAFFLFPLCPLQWVGWGWAEVGRGNQESWRKLTKGYSILYGIMDSSNSWGKEQELQSHLWLWYLFSQVTTVECWGSAFQEESKHLPANVKKNFVFCFSCTLNFALPAKLTFPPTMYSCFRSFCSLLYVTRFGKWAGGYGTLSYWTGSTHCQSKSLQMAVTRAILPAELCVILQVC